MLAKKLFLNTSIYSIGIILPQAVGFILLPIYTRYLSTADFGIVSSMHVLKAILAAFLTLSLERSIIRLYWDYKTENTKRDFLGTVTISSIVVSVVMVSLLFLFRNTVGQIYKSIDFSPYFVYAILTGFLFIFSHVPKMYLILKEKAGIFVLLTSLELAANIFFILWFVIGKKEGAAGYLKGQMLGVAVLLPLYVYISLKAINFKFHFSPFKSSLFFSLPIIPTILSAWVLNLSDRIFLERYFTLEDVGIYSLGYKIAGLILIFSGAFNLAYSPIFFKLASSDDQSNSKNTLFKYNYIYLQAVIIICFAISFFAKEIITLIFDSKYHPAHFFVPLIALSYLFVQADGVTGFFFQQSRKMKQNMVKGLLVAGANIILNFLLIPRFGAFGAAYATILSMGLCFFASYIYTKRYCYFIPFNWKYIIPLVGVLVSIVAFFQYGLVLDVLMSFIMKIIVLGIIGGIFLKKYYPQLKALLVKS